MAENLKIGDVCRVRDWDDMAAEKSNDNNPNRDTRIKLPNGCISFINDMHHLCGQIFTIKRIVSSGPRVDTYLSVEGIELRNTTNGLVPWYITADMLERLEWAEDPFEGDCTLDLSDLF